MYNNILYIYIYVLQYIYIYIYIYIYVLHYIYICITIYIYIQSWPDLLVLPTTSNLTHRISFLRCIWWHLHNAVVSCPHQVGSITTSMTALRSMCPFWKRQVHRCLKFQVEDKIMSHCVLRILGGWTHGCLNLCSSWGGIWSFSQAKGKK